MGFNKCDKRCDKTPQTCLNRNRINNIVRKAKIQNNLRMLKIALEFIGVILSKQRIK